MINIEHLTLLFLMLSIIVCLTPFFAANNKKIWIIFLLLLPVWCCILSWMVYAASMPNELEYITSYPVHTVYGNNIKMQIIIENDKIINVNSKFGVVLPPQYKIEKYIFKNTYAGLYWEKGRLNKNSEYKIVLDKD